jgi:peptide/nickel transport system permease protein
MLSFIVKRFLILIPLLFLISIVTFVIIQLPPGDILTQIISAQMMSNTTVAKETIARLTVQYGLDQPVYVQYYRWMSNLLFRGDLGWSFQWNQPVSKIIGERIVLTVVISLLTTIFIWIVAVPIGIYSATHQYSLPDYIATIVGFIGLATPGFLLAMVMLWFIYIQFGISIAGLFSAEYVQAPWSLARIWDLLKHVWAPVIIIGLSGTGGLIRVMRGTLLDELKKQYVITARAKGLPEMPLLFKYPVRVAINPLISTIGWMLPGIISGEVIVSIVLNLPTTGPLLWGALLAQDMYLAGSFMLILSSLSVTGTLISDILLAWLDPRIRYGGIEK